ncbi:MAG: lipoate--protein ligase family protein [Promethearchaeota archaeon]|nr:MAG: lipoate--protein ligase family protein [Candidatus Lokiarchaeota archaeon]
MDSWRFIPLQIRNGFWNMAIDEAILYDVTEGKIKPTLRFYKWKPSTASIGRNQSLSDEVDIEFCNQRGFNIVRRITGGGAVFHDQFREITYGIICPINYLKKQGASTLLEQFELITQGIVLGLKIFGLKTNKGIIHCPALFLDEKKFSGNAQLRRKGYVLQHGTILLDLDPELMYSVLKTPPNVSKSRMVRSVKAKCIGVKEYLYNYDEEGFLNSLKQGFSKALRVEFENEKLSQHEKNIAKSLVEEKYKKDSWLKKYE